LTGQYENMDLPPVQVNGLTATWDDGKTFVNYDCGITTAYTRYGHFPSPTTWFLAAGVWPSLDAWDNDPEARVISQKIRIHKQFGVQFRHVWERENLNHATVYGSRRGRSLLQTSGYVAAVARTTDGGKTWATVFSDMGDYYFNDIDCPTTTDCWVVGESESDSPNPGVRIIHTADGGATWDTQLYINDPTYSLIEIAMVNATEGWASGAILTRGINGQFFHTTDGKTWTMAQALTDEYAMAMSLFKNPNAANGTYQGWASAFTLEGSSSVLVYK